MASHSPQRARRPAHPATGVPAHNLREASRSPAHRERPRTLKAQSVPIVPSAIQVFAANNQNTQPSQQSQQQPSPTSSMNSRRSPPAGMPVQRLLPTPPQPNPMIKHESPERGISPQLAPQHQNPPHFHPRPINRAPPQFLAKYQDIDLQMNDLMAEFERTDYTDIQQPQASVAVNSAPAYNGYSRGQSNSPPRDPAVERVRATERSSPKEVDAGQQRRQQAPRESPKVRDRQPNSPTASSFVQAPIQQSSEQVVSPQFQGPLASQGEHHPGYAQYSRDSPPVPRRASNGPVAENRLPRPSQTPPLQAITARTPDRSLPVQEELEDDPGAPSKNGIDTREVWQGDQTDNEHRLGSSPTPSSDLSSETEYDGNHLHGGRSSRTGHRDDKGPVMKHEDGGQLRFPDREDEESFTPRSPNTGLPDHRDDYYGPQNINAMTAQTVRGRGRTGTSDQLGLRSFDPAVFEQDQPMLPKGSEHPPAKYIEQRRPMQNGQQQQQPQREQQQPNREQQPQREQLQLLPQREPQQPQREPHQPQREPQQPQREPQQPQREPQQPQREPQQPQRDQQPQQQPQQQQPQPQREQQQQLQLQQREQQQHHYHSQLQNQRFYDSRTPSNHLDELQYGPPYMHPDDFQTYSDDGSIAYLQNYMQSPRPDAPIPPTPHSQTAAPSPLVSGGYDGGKILPPFTPIPPAGSPYPYPYSHVRRMQHMPGYPDYPPMSSNSNYDPNLNAIQEQMARQWQVYAMNHDQGNISDSTFSPSTTPFQGYNPWAYLHTSRMLGGRHRATMSLQSSPSHEPIALPTPPMLPKKKTPQAGMRRPSNRKPPPRVESTQPRETSPEMTSSGEETAGEEHFNVPDEGIWVNGAITILPPDDDKDWIDEDEDDDDLLELEYHPGYVSNVEKRRRRWEIGWESLTQAFQDLDRQTDATMMLLAAPSHSTKLYALKSRAIRRQGTAADAASMKEVRTGFNRVASHRRNTRSHKSSIVERFMSPSSGSGGDGSDGSSESREEDLKRALGAALGSLGTLGGIYEQREARWIEEMRRISEDRERVELLLRQVLGEGRGPFSPGSTSIASHTT